jgi:lipopolysaccharide biosynthesis protein
VFPNKGRDVLPFLVTAKMLQRAGTYEYFLKLHSKKSLHRSDGNEWLKSLLNELIPDDSVPIIHTLERSDTGSIGPESHVVSLTRYLHPNRENIEKILRKLIDKRRTKYIVDRASLYPFFGGTMLWARLDFVEPVINKSLASIKFEKEKGQVDGTIAHALERVFGGLLHEVTKRKMYTVGKSGVQKLPEKLYEDEYKYVG